MRREAVRLDLKDEREGVGGVVVVVGGRREGVSGMGMFGVRRSASMGERG